MELVEIVDLRNIPHESMGSISSPEFEAPIPNIVNSGLIPIDMFNSMNVSWSRGVFSEQTIRVDKIFDVLITSEGLIFTRDIKIIRESITQHSHSEILDALGRVRNFSDTKKVTTPCLLLRKRGDDNYGHWMVELLPKFTLAQSCCDVPSLLIPDIEGPMGKVITDSLDLVDKMHAIPKFGHKNENVVFVQELIIVSGASAHGVFMSPNIVSSLDQITSDIPGTGLKRVYVSRKGARRNIENETEVEFALKKIGFHIVHPGNLDLRQQISSFRDADTIVGVMGAGMTNIVFANSGAKVINLCPATMPDTFFYFLSLHKKHHYNELRGLNNNGGTSWDEEFLIEKEELIKIVEA